MVDTVGAGIRLSREAKTHKKDNRNHVRSFIASILKFTFAASFISNLKFVIYALDMLPIDAL